MVWDKSVVSTWKVKVVLDGRVERGVGQASRRMASSPEIYERAFGERLFPGTLNVRVERRVPLREHFRIFGIEEKNDPTQDLLVEVCLLDEIIAYRICPWRLESGLGGHGDYVIELACPQKMANMTYGSRVTVSLFWDDAVRIDDTGAE